MAKKSTARVFMSGRSQHVTIPAEFRFETDKVQVRRGSKKGELVLSPIEDQAEPDWEAIFAELDAVVPKDFMKHRDQGKFPKRKSL